ncbi:MAG TPA: DUF481 domain-containing protein [Acidobacteriota bacterium]|nr:DUF481 domain-containing protein [Acidobacteriota bacterium]
MRRTLFFISTFWFFSAWAWADQVVLKNQDRLTGTVASLKDGKLMFTTSYAGEVAISWAEVASLQTDQPQEIVLSDGRETTASVAPAGEEGLARLQVPSRTDQVALADIVSIGIESPEPPTWWERWDGTANFGFDLSRGNTDRENLSLSFRPRRQGEDYRLQAAYQLDFSMETGVEDNRIQDGSARYDRFLGEKFFYYFLGGFTTNQRQELDLRTREGAGFGYEFSRGAASLSVFGGLTAVQEKFEGLQRSNDLQGLAGIEMASPVLGGGEVATKFEYEPRLTDSGRYLMRWIAQLNYPLFRGLTVGTELFDYFDSDPSSGNERNDFGLNIVFGWKF